MSQPQNPKVPTTQGDRPVPKFGAWEEEESYRAGFDSLSSGRQTPRNYGRAPLISANFDDYVRPLPSVNEDAYGGGNRTMYDQNGSESIVQVGNASQGYGKTNQAQAEGCITEFSRPRRARRTRVSHMAPLKRDTTPNNFATDSVQLLQSVDEGAYDGGTRTGGDTKTDKHGKVPLIMDNFVDNAQPLLSINEDAYGGSNSDPEQAEAYATWNRLKLPEEDTTTRNHGRAPFIQDLFNDSARPLPSGNEDAFGGGIRTRYDRRYFETVVQVSNAGQGCEVSAPQVSMPSEQKSTRQVYPTANTTEKYESLQQQRYCRLQNETIISEGRSFYLSSESYLAEGRGTCDKIAVKAAHKINQKKYRWYGGVYDYLK